MGGIVKLRRSPAAEDLQKTVGLARYGRYKENFVLVLRRSASPKRQRGSVAMVLAGASGFLSGVAQGCQGCQAFVSRLCTAKREFCSRFLNSRPSPGSLLKAPWLSPLARGEGEDWEWGANPGVRWRSTPGYQYSAPSGASTKPSAIPTPDSLSQPAVQ